VELFPHDLDAQRLKMQTFTLGEFLVKKAPGFALPRLERKALVHGHCHQRSVLDYPSDQKALAGLGLDMERPESGCCGMAGSFGFEEDKYQVSVQCGERVLLPRVRQLDENALIVADGFSCKTQILQGTGRQALHTAQVLKMGLQRGQKGRAGTKPESQYADNGGHAALRRAQRNATLSAGALAAAGILVGLARATRPRSRRGITLPRWKGRR
ncbi:MAG TPA: FAD-binding oxidoreductase, partial [Myxococcaceae bacterium]|nr:FAD-binding oxidoreductase [Myxococcaceae bacterium]